MTIGPETTENQNNQNNENQNQNNQNQNNQNQNNENQNQNNQNENNNAIPENPEDMIYATFYTDGTLAFSSTNTTLEGKTVSSRYITLENAEYSYEETIPWYNVRTRYYTSKIC